MGKIIGVFGYDKINERDLIKWESEINEAKIVIGGIERYDDWIRTIEKLNRSRRNKVIIFIHRVELHDRREITPEKIKDDLRNTQNLFVATFRNISNNNINQLCKHLVNITSSFLLAVDRATGAS